MRRNLTVVLAGSAVLLSTAIAGCSSKKSTATPIASSPPGAPQSTAGSPSAGAANTLTIAAFKYDPTPLTVKAGATVTVTNTDATEHTATSSPSGAFAVDVSKGSPKTFTAPTTPGTYKIICSFHPSMAGQLIVTS